MQYVFLVYGLAFFLMGLSILSYPGKNIARKDYNNLRLLGWFGVLHGLNEWLDMLLLWPAAPFILKSIRLVILPLSFLILFYLGLQFVMALQKRWQRLLSTAAVAAIWSTLTLFSANVSVSGDVLARLLFAFPGSLLAGYGLWKTATGTNVSNPRQRRPLKWCGGTLMIYGFFGGLIFPPGDFFPASIFNYPNFRELFYIPPQIFRALCAVLIMFFVLKYLYLGLISFVAQAKIRNLFELTLLSREPGITDGVSGEPAFANAAETLILTDQEFNILLVNAGTLKLLGGEEDDFVGKPISQWLSAAANYYVSLREDLDKNGFFGNREMDLHTRQGNCPMVFSGSLIKDEFTERQGVVWFGHSIARHKILEEDLERKKAQLETRLVAREQELSDTKQQLELKISEQHHVEEILEFTQFAMDSAPSAIYWVLPDGRIVYANRAAELQLEYTHDELLNTHIYDIDPIYHREVWRIHCEEVKRSGSITYESKNRRKDGTFFPVEIHSNYLSYKNYEYLCLFVFDIKTRKESEKEIRQTQAQLALYTSRLEQEILKRNRELNAILKHTPALVYIKDREGKYLMVNPQFENLFSTTKEKVHGKTDYDIFPSKYAEQFHQNDQKALAIKQFLQIEETYPHPHGERTYYTVKFPIFDENNYPYAVCGLSMDITALKETEAALRESEEKFRALGDSAYDAIIMLDENNRISFWNKAAEKTFGYTAVEALGKDAYLFLQPRTLDGSPQPFVSRPQDGLAPKSRSTEALLSRKNGAEFPAEISLAPMSLRQRAGLICIIRDISDRKLNELELKKYHDHLEELVESRSLELRESESRLRRAVLDAPFPVILHAEGGEILLFSSVLSEIIGYAREELSSLPDWMDKAFAREQADAWQKFQATYSQNQRSHEGEFAIKTKSGEERIWDFSSAPLGSLPDGRRLVITMATDVTERNKAEIGLAKHTEELARSNQELQNFAYIASHDLQEPLRIISNYAQLLARRYRGKLDSDADDYILYVTDGALRMKQMISDWLSYARVGAAKINFVEIPLSEIVRDVITYLQLKVEETGATVITGNLPNVYGERALITQLLQNLVANALKFHGEQKPEIRIFAQRDNEAWRIGVQDNGIGIPTGDKERIFNIFERLHTKEEYSGTGIGLAICRKIVEYHEGHIWVESEPGKGSTFYFTLPDKE